MKINKIFSILLAIICFVLMCYISFTNKCFTDILFKIMSTYSSGDIKETISNEENNYREIFKQKNSFVELYGSYAKISGFWYVNKVARLKDGFLYYIPATNEPIKKIENNIQNLMEFKKFNNALKIPLSIFIFPNIDDVKGIELPPSLKSTTTMEFDFFVQKAKKSNLDCYDMRYMAENQDPNYAYFKTDHHWKPRFAFDVFVEILKIFQEKYKIPYLSKASDINNYNITAYKNVFLGSAGRRTGKAYSGVDDIDIIEPKFANSLKIIKKQKEDLSVIGDYSNNIINKDLLDPIKHEGKQYDAYGEGMSIEQYINQDENAKGTIVILSVSYNKVNRGFLL